MSNGPTYQYIIVTNEEEVIQFDWKLEQRDGVHLGYKAYELPLSRNYIGMKIKDINLEPLQFFIRPK
jgi:hypothetical protein